MTPSTTAVQLPDGVHRDLGLTDEEFDSIKARLGRDPTYVELAMFSVMWSEHCSYKSSRVHLTTLPTEGPQVVLGPGEGAGVIEVAPGVLVAWKIESHNHPSYVEPFSGAATGVGGIVRDILSMGARPIALLDSLRFGRAEETTTQYLLEGVVSGISAYGNSIGVPTVGGEVFFADSYDSNPLVNVACLGIVEGELMRGRAEGSGNAVVLYGSSTGRDGIGGASVLASAEFDETSAEKRPAVQVGDPFSEKLLIEATLELIRSGLIVGLQDLGAGGLSCPASEMPAKSGAGVRVQTESVHLREPGMEPFEIMISESQERMLAIVEPARVEAALEVCRRWGLDARVVGEVTDTGRLEVATGMDRVADVPVRALAEEGPVYERPMLRPSWIDDLHRANPGDAAPDDLKVAFLEVLSSPSIASKRWVWEQYDHMIFLGTVRGPGSDAAVIRLPDQDVAVALSVDGPGRFCFLDPYEGARLAVCEAARNVVSSGGRPLAVTNCLNFGNPEKPEVMWQFAEVVRGIKDACRALSTPVTGGNVSFYNETDGRPIYPTPVIGMLGVVEDLQSTPGIDFKQEGDAILLLGSTGETDFGGSEYARIVNGVVAGRPPHLDVAGELALHALMTELIRDQFVVSAHDLSDGGLAVALAESSLTGEQGFSLRDEVDHRFLFSESPSRCLVSCGATDVEEVVTRARRHGVQERAIGRVGGEELDFGAFRCTLEEAKHAFENALPALLSHKVD